MKTTTKIAVIAMMGISLGVNAQHNYDNQNTIYSKDGGVGLTIGGLFMVISYSSAFESTFVRAFVFVRQSVS